MAVFFAFSDESGKYKKDRTDKFILKNPFYCRSTVFLETEDWLRLRNEFFSLKKNFLKVDISQDVKWSYIWSLYKHRKKGEAIPSIKPYFPLRNHSLDILVEFIRRVLQCLADSPSSRILLTLTFNERDKTGSVDIQEIVEQHLKHTLDMAEREMRKASASTCVFFFNPEEPPLEKKVLRAFTRIYKDGFPRRYGRIKDSFGFELFPKSIGGQLADYCAGVFNGCCRLYPQSIDLFRNQVQPRLIREKGKVLGFGIKNIPENVRTRACLEEILEEVFSLGEEEYKVSADERTEWKPLS